MNTAKMRNEVFTSAIIVTVALSQFAFAQEKAWRGSAAGQTAPLIESAGQYDEFGGWGGGHLGNFLAIGTHTMHSDLSLTGQATWVAADGELLYVSYEGMVTITEDQDRPYTFTATMEVLGGTGRLQGATGYAEMLGSFNAWLDQFRFDFEGTLDIQGNLKTRGQIELDSLTCGLGESVAYVMTSDSRHTPLAHQTGSMILASDPVVDDSDPNITVWTFQVETGLNEHVGRPLHVVHTSRGNLYCQFEGQVRLEIDHTAEGLTTKCFDGFYTIIGGTGDYRRARGCWRTIFTTQPSYGGPATAKFFVDGNLEMNHNPTGPRELTAQGVAEQERPSNELPSEPMQAKTRGVANDPSPGNQSNFPANKPTRPTRLRADQFSRGPADPRALPPLPQPGKLMPFQRSGRSTPSLPDAQPTNRPVRSPAAMLTRASTSDPKP